MSQDPILRVDSHIETQPSITARKSYAYRYAYARSADSRASNETGQDYLAFHPSETDFTFVLCDGVSQSFFGDLAAKLLGDALLEWLEKLPAGMEFASVQESLSALLSDLTQSATEWVQNQPLPPDISTMLKGVLEQKRAHGSETTFACGRIDLPNTLATDGRLLLTWMGDSRLRFWGQQGERSAELGDSFHTAERWSTRRGPVNGEAHIAILPLVDKSGHQVVRRLITYSDGLASLDAWDNPPSNAALENLIEQAQLSATSDDISLIEIWLGHVPEVFSDQPDKRFETKAIPKVEKEKRSFFGW